MGASRYSHVPAPLSVVLLITDNVPIRGKVYEMYGPYLHLPTPLSVEPLLTDNFTSIDRQDF